MALSKASQVMATVVLMTIICLMSSEVATAVPGDAIPILKLGRRVLLTLFKGDYPGYGGDPSGGGGYYYYSPVPQGPYGGGGGGYP